MQKLLSLVPYYLITGVIGIVEPGGMLAMKLTLPKRIGLTEHLPDMKQCNTNLILG